MKRKTKLLSPEDQSRFISQLGKIILIEVKIYLDRGKAYYHLEQSISQLEKVYPSKVLPLGVKHIPIGESIPK